MKARSLGEKSKVDSSSLSFCGDIIKTIVWAGNLPFAPNVGLKNLFGHHPREEHGQNNNII